jgi:TetR/AcrR family transcriptional regulator, tetracycline repressor protein
MVAGCPNRSPISPDDRFDATPTAAQWWNEVEDGREIAVGDRSASNAALGPSTQRAHLSRERIIQVAIEYVDDHGLTALTMRRLGKELGVEAMSLYRYVNGREDLLEGMVDHMVATLHITSRADALGPADGWQAYLQWLAHGVRALAREHPKVFPLIATRHPAAPWLRPPLRSLRVVEDFLTTLISRGFSDNRAVTAYRAFSSFLLGHLLLEASLLGAQTSPAEEPLDEGESDVPNADQQLDLREFPHVERLRDTLSEDHAGAEFERALEDLLDRLDREIAE